MAPNPTFNSKASLMMRVEKVEANVQDDTQKYQWMKFIRGQRQDQENTTGTRKHGWKRQTRQEQGNSRTVRMGTNDSRNHRNSTDNSTMTEEKS